MKALKFVRVSLKDILLFLVFVGLGCAALRMANTIWVTSLTAVAILMFMGCGLMAAIDRGRRQSFGIGFVVCVCTYTVLVYFSSDYGSGGEMDPYTGRLPTSVALRPVYQAVVNQVSVDPQSNAQTVMATSYAQVMSAATPAPASMVATIAATPPIVGAYPSPSPVATTSYTWTSVPTLPAYSEFPERRNFMVVGHVLWTLLLGLVGGRVGCILYAHRTANDSKAKDAA